jgi:transposase-like protein
MLEWPPCDGQRDHANGSRERTQRTVALDQSALLEVLDALKAAEVDDRIGQAAQTIYQALIEAELTAVIGAAPHERTSDRLAQRNGHRPRVLSTTAGDLELRIPKLAMRPVNAAGLTA